MTMTPDDLAEKSTVRAVFLIALAFLVDPVHMPMIAWDYAKKSPRFDPLRDLGRVLRDCWRALHNFNRLGGRIG